MRCQRVKLRRSEEPRKLYAVVAVDIGHNARGPYFFKAVDVLNGL